MTNELQAAPKAEKAKKEKQPFFGAWLKYKLKEIRKNWVLYLFMLPFLLVFVVLTILPVVTAIYYSFTYFNVLEAPKFIFWDNYTRMFIADDLFMTALKNTLLIAAILGPGGYLLSLFFAWLINELSPKVRAFMTLIYYAPCLANVYAVWKLIFGSDAYGYLNGVLLSSGITLQNIRWLEDVNYIMPCIIIVLLWGSLGVSFLSFIAGLQNVDRTLYEAGALDGVKNRWQELWYITLPYMRPQLMFGAIMSITGAFSVGDQITALAGYPTQDYVAHTFLLHIQDYGGSRMEMGYACALTVVLFLLMVFGNKLVQKVINKVGD